MSLSQEDLSRLITQLGAALGSFQSSISSINTDLGGTAQAFSQNNTAAIDTASTLDDSISELDARLERARGNTRSFFDSVGEVTSEVSAILVSSLERFEDLEKTLITQSANTNEALNKIQKSYGGQFRASANEVGESVRRLTIDSLKTMGALSQEELDKLDERQKIMVDGQQRNILDLAFENTRELSNFQNGILESLSMAHSDSFKNMSSVQMDQILALGKTADLNASEIAGILERQKAMTGEMNEDLLQEMLAYAASTEKSVGLSSKVVMQAMVDLQKQVATFGTEGPKELAKISAGLQKLGVDAQTAGQMINKFMSFESAVSSISDLTTVFGVQMDAMEMTMLANTDRTEFLRRMRESILDAGVDVENMNQAHLNLLTQQLGMNQDEVRNFLKTGQEDFFAEIEEGIEETDPEAEMANLLLQGENFLRTQEDMMELSNTKMMAHNIEVNESLAAQANSTASSIQGTIQQASFEMAAGTDRMIKIAELALLRLDPEEIATKGAEFMAVVQKMDPEEFFKKSEEFGINFASGFKDGSGDLTEMITQMINDGFMKSLLSSSSPSEAFYNMLEGFTGTESSALFSLGMENLGIIGNQSIQSNMEDISPDLDEEAFVSSAQRMADLVNQVTKSNLKDSEMDVTEVGSRILESKKTLIKGIEDQTKQTETNDKLHHKETLEKYDKLIELMNNLDQRLRDDGISNQITFKVEMDKAKLYEALTTYNKDGEQISTFNTDIANE